MIDGEKAAAPTQTISRAQLEQGVVLKKGKKVYHKVVLG